MTLAPGWRWIARMIARCSLNQPAIRLFSGPLMARPMSRDADRRAVAIGDDQIGVFVGLEQLIVGVERVGLARAVERAFRQVDIRLAEHAADVLEADAARLPAPADRPATRMAGFC